MLVQLDLLMSTNVTFDTRQLGLTFLLVMHCEYCFPICNNPHILFAGLFVLIP